MSLALTEQCPECGNLAHCLYDKGPLLRNRGSPLWRIGMVVSCALYACCALLMLKYESLALQSVLMTLQNSMEKISGFVIDQLRMVSKLA
ncbi:hypothetical protein MATL_G00092110 [Megalops atlanticus]|uniref:Uncharacterized protein n=1 Tax=Megalops atlanticus TaxID=7932 RepID=A0A9D3TBM9_MEGAT|nr:hypothetical protein MATL_G00092110 [Megalops atlanticus]